MVQQRQRFSVFDQEAARGRSHRKLNNSSFFHLLVKSSTESKKCHKNNAIYHSSQFPWATCTEKPPSMYFRDCNFYLLCNSHVLKYEKTIHTQPQLNCCSFPCIQLTSLLKCIRLVSVRSSLPCLNIVVRLELPTDTLTEMQSVLERLTKF